MKYRTKWLVAVAGGIAGSALASGLAGPALANGVTRTAVAAPAADVIITNARIYTADPRRPEATAMAMRKGRIIYVGDEKGANAFRGRRTRIENLDGKRVLPGLVDAHVHPLGLVDTGGCDLNGTPHSLAEIGTVVAGCIKDQKLKPGEWLLVNQWTYSNGNQADPKNVTIRAALDAAAPSNPIKLVGNDGHHNAFNSAAFALAKAPDGKVIGLNGATLAGPFKRFTQLVAVGGDGEPTGGVNEEAGDVMKRSGFIDRDGIMKAPEKVMQVLASSGITAFLDAAADPEDAIFYDTLIARNAFTARATLAQYHDPEAVRTADGAVDYDRLVADAIRFRAHFAGNPLVRADAIKFFADGVLEGDPLAHPPTFPNGAVLHPYHAPKFGRDAAGRAVLNGYADAPGPSGKLQHDEAVIMTYIARMHAAGFQLHIHAIGDRAIRVAVDAVEAARATDGTHPPVARADTLAHLQLVNPAEVERIGRNRMFLAFTYAWAYTDPEYDLTVIPFIDRVRDGSFGALHDPANYYERQAYPVRQLADAGAILVAGSDAPVETRDPRPFVNMQVAVTRARDGTAPLGAREAIDIGSAIKAYTIDGARSIGRDDEIGSLTVGKSADFIVLDRDILAIPSEQIGDTKVLSTWFMGKSIHSATVEGK